MSNTKPMLLVTITLTNQLKTFMLIPNPLYQGSIIYPKGVFNPETKALILQSDSKREAFQMVPKLDINGDLARTKKPRENGATYAEQRVLMTVPNEHEITEKQEILNIIEIIAENSNSFEYKKYLEESKIIVPEKPKLELIK